MESSNSLPLKILCPGCGRKLDVSGVPPFSEVHCPSCRQPLTVPCWFHNLLLEERLQERGGCCLYRALDPSLDREVVVRCLGAEQAAVLGRRFIDSFRKVARLSHPGIVQFYGCGEDEGKVYSVSQFIRGLNLGEQRQAGGLPQPGEVQQLLQRAVETLGYAAEQGVLHGHIVPENLLLNEDGELYVSDFGLSGSLGLGQGENPYRAPEQSAEGEATLAGDIFSLAVCFYEYATGHLPGETQLVRGQEAEMVAERGRQEISSALPKGLSEILLKMLSVEPGRRPGSYGEILAALQSSSQVSRLAHRKLTVKGKQGMMTIHLHNRPGLPQLLSDGKRRGGSLLNLLIFFGLLILAGLGIYAFVFQGRGGKSESGGAGKKLFAIASQLPQRLQEELQEEVQEEVQGMSAEEIPRFAWQQLPSEGCFELEPEVLELRPRPDDLDFAACRAANTAYLEAVPEELREVERTRLRNLGVYKSYLLNKIQKMGAYTPAGGSLLLRDGRKVSGTVTMFSSEKALKVRLEGDGEEKLLVVPWDKLNRQEIWKMAEHYIRLLQERSTKGKGGQAVFEEYMYLLMLCDWYEDTDAFGGFLQQVQALELPGTRQKLEQFFPPSMLGNLQLP